MKSVRARENNCGSFRNVKLSHKSKKAEKHGKYTYQETLSEIYLLSLRSVMVIAWSCLQRPQEGARAHNASLAMNLPVRKHHVGALLLIFPPS